MKYDTRTIALHWFTAVSVGALWIIGQTAYWIPRGAVRSDYRSVHVVLGFAIAVGLILRILWRSLRGRRLPAADSGVLRLLAEATHYALYALLLIVVALGVVNAFVRGYNLFGLFSLPQLGEADLSRPITHWHGLASDVLVGLAFLHACAALAHHYVLKDDVLRRMLPRSA
jgi:cytochrome b561